MASAMPENTAVPIASLRTSEDGSSGGSSRYCRFVNMLGLPSIAVPVGFDDRGMPVAIELIGRAGRDRSLIALAKHMSKNTDWHARIPSAITSSIIGDLELFG
jgi:Asp-tRNA(Asn)/Glu-tRNA(Gln) amidotransferase A subunit family amidase